ncbi:MAG TPA: 4Fe-4S ferredoxin [Desulfobacteraceae bacterium]|nr:4Fe-4S ferredoxin [Desulfobacteraceae bacterium]
MYLNKYNRTFKIAKFEFCSPNTYFNLTRNLKTLITGGMKIAVAHKDQAYRDLQRHLNRLPVGFPPSSSGADIRLLKHIFSPLQARIATTLTHEPEDLATLFLRAGHLVKSPGDLKTELTAMVKNGGLEIAKTKEGQTCWANAPLVVGMYELQLDRLTPEFIRDFKAYTSEKRFGISFLGTGLSQMRTIPIHKSLRPDLPLADVDRIEDLLDLASPPFVILPCICRRKKAMAGEPCRQTERTETCMAMGGIARTLMEMDIGRKIDREEALAIIRENQKEGLVLQPANTRHIEFLCSCCGCCCSMLSLQRDLPVPLDFWSANHRAELERDRCVGCGKCIKRCQAGALTLKELQGRMACIEVNPHRCIGCGHCVAVCPTKAMRLSPKPAPDRPPKNRADLNRIMLKERHSPLAPVKVIGKLARGIAVTRDIRLLKSPD